MFLYFQNETTYSIKFGIVLKLVMSSKTPEKEIWHSTHTVEVVMTDIWTSKMAPENKFRSERVNLTVICRPMFDGLEILVGIEYIVIFVLTGPVEYVSLPLPPSYT